MVNGSALRTQDTVTCVPFVSGVLLFFVDGGGCVKFVLFFFVDEGRSFFQQEVFIRDFSPAGKSDGVSRYNNNSLIGCQSNLAIQV